MPKITFSNKIDNQVSVLPLTNKVTAADLNEVKESVNELYDTIGGWVDYADASTSVTPINLTQNVWTDLTNDKLGADTITTYKPPFVTGDLWNSASNSVNFSEIGIGQVLIIRNDFDVTAGASNTRLDARLYFPDSGKSIEFMHDNIAENNELVRYSRTTQIFIKQSELASGCKIQVKVNKSGSTAKVENFLINVISHF
tara:strand:+ start:3775 stop:4371 length:597 start_codon:yes stop_codon:yes gene_type:complete